MIAADLAQALLRHLPAIAGFHAHDKRVVCVALVEWLKAEIEGLRRDLAVTEGADGSLPESARDALRHSLQDRQRQYAEVLEMLGGAK